MGTRGCGERAMGREGDGANRRESLPSASVNLHASIYPFRRGNCLKTACDYVAIGLVTSTKPPFAHWSVRDTILAEDYHANKA